MPPVYAPAVVAETILHAAVKPVRDVYAGGGAKGMATMAHLAPGGIDRPMEKMVIPGTPSGRPPLRPMERNGLDHATERLEERGNYEGHVMRTSLYTKAALNPLATAAALIGTGAALFAARKLLPHLPARIGGSAGDTTAKALHITLEARPGKADEVAALLAGILRRRGKPRRVLAVRTLAQRTVVVEHRGQRSGMRPGLGIAVERARLERALVCAALDHAPEPGEVEAAERRLGHPWQLEERHVGAFQRLGRMLQRLLAPDVGVGSVHQHDALQPFRIPGRNPPADDSAPIVGDKMEAIRAIRVGDADHVGGQRVELVGRDLLRLVAGVVAAHVGHDDVIAGLGKRRDLMAPSPPELGKAVKQHQQRRIRIARLNDMEVQAVDPLGRLGPAGLEQVGGRARAHAGISSMLAVLTAMTPFSRWRKSLSAL